MHFSIKLAEEVVCMLLQYALVCFMVHYDIFVVPCTHILGVHFGTYKYVHIFVFETIIRFLLQYRFLAFRYSAQYTHSNYVY